MNEYDVSNELQTFLKKEPLPFTLGEGFEKILLKIGYKSYYDHQNKKIKIIYNVYFEVNKVIENKLSDSILIRADNIRKKIKSAFHKCIIEIINEDIKKKISDKNRKYYFANLPQIFIANVNKAENSEKMNMEFEKLLLHWKNKKNIDMIEYLNNNPDLCEKTIWNKVKNMTYKQLLESYFISAEFEKTICNLQAKSEKKNKKVSALYIENYINLALSYTDFYTNSELNNYTPSNNNSNSLPSNPDEYIYFYGNHNENKNEIEQDEPEAKILELSFGFIEKQLVEDENITIMDEENDSRSEKMSCSDNEEKMNGSFDEKNDKKSLENQIIFRENF